MRILGQDVNFEIENKRKAALSVGVIILCIGFTAHNLAGKLTNTTPSSSNTQQQTASTAKPASGNQGSSSGGDKSKAAASSDDKSGNLTIANSVLSLQDLLAYNPFVEMKDVAPLEGSSQYKTNNSVTRTKGGSGNSGNVTYGPTGDIPLPSIPSAGRPLSMDIPPAIGSGSSSGGGSSRSSAKPASISGIMSATDGSFMAIMGDGTLVQAGDTYNGNEVSSVDESGVSFADGSSIAYK